MKIDSITYRKANESDAEQLIDFFIKGFLKTFGKNYDLQDIRLYLENYNPETALQWIEEDYVLVAVDGDQNIGGFVSVGKCTVPFDQVTPDDGEIKKMYVDQKYFGTGLAHSLFEKGLERVKEEVDGNIYIDSYSENGRALKFYQKKGFEPVGTCKYAVGNHEDLDYVLRYAQ
ncbi:hypothetical protein HDV01_005841 [Terramyces sp. JEL0728]|nr:hypothetical protein HDV01_005841 [Terramyces sp. JEL0728]